MKIKVLSVAAALTAGLMFTTSSCDKLKDALFQAFYTQGVSQTFDIPIINTTNTETTFGTLVDKFNIDSIIKAETNDAFSLNDIKKITITEAKVTLLNADVDNNFANFESGMLTFSTNSNPTPLTVATGPNPDVYSETFMLPPIPDTNLKSYLAGSELTYVISGKARRVTNKVLNARLDVKFYIE